MILIKTICLIWNLQWKNKLKKWGKKMVFINLIQNLGFKSASLYSIVHGFIIFIVIKYSS